MTFNLNPDILIVDNFYDDPLAVRNTALTCEYLPAKHDDNFRLGNAPWPGKMSKSFYSPANLDLKLSKLLGKHVRQMLNLNSGKFRISSINDSSRNLVHRDNSGYAGVCYLNPNLYSTPGTIFYTHKESKMARGDKFLYEKIIRNNDDNDLNKWEVNLISYIVFNRLIIYPADLFHGIGPLFGSTDEESRLVQLFFWEVL